MVFPPITDMDEVRINVHSGHKMQCTNMNERVQLAKECKLFQLYVTRFDDDIHIL